MQEQYAAHLSGYTTWNQLEHGQQWILYPEIIGKNLSLDETCLSNGDLYTILTNKAAKDKKGALVAMVKGTVSDTVIEVLHKILESKGEGNNFRPCSQPWSESLNVAFLRLS